MLTFHSEIYFTIQKLTSDNNDTYVMIVLVFFKRFGTCCTARRYIQHLMLSFTLLYEIILSRLWITPFTNNLKAG